MTRPNPFAAATSFADNGPREVADAVTLANLRKHVQHLLYAIDRGYFGDDCGLRDSAFVAPLRAFVTPIATIAADQVAA